MAGRVHRQIAFAAICCTALIARSQTAALDGRSVAPFATPARARVFLFVRTDCPITNRYAPEMRRLAQEFKNEPVDFWLVYEDASEEPAAIGKHIAEYELPGTPLRDMHHELAQRAHATVSPESAVFDGHGTLIYRGRIDDRYVDFGKARQSAQIHDLEGAITAVLAGKAVAQPETRAIGCSLADVSDGR